MKHISNLYPRSFTGFYGHLEDVFRHLAMITVRRVFYGATGTMSRRTKKEEKRQRTRKRKNFHFIRTTLFVSLSLWENPLDSSDMF